MKLYDWVRWTHVLAGVVALSGFWLNAALRKGSPLHSRVGRAYLVAMLVIMSTAIVMAIGSFVTAQPVRGTFLAYLVVITAAPSWMVWRAIRDKRNVLAYTGMAYRALAVSSVASGVLVLGLGIYYQAKLLMGFSIVGILAGGAMWRLVRTPPTHPKWWLRQHYTGVVACGAATHIAFFNLGAARILPASFLTDYQVLAWLAPVAAAVLAGVWLDRRYHFAGSRPSGVLLPN